MNDDALIRLENLKALKLTASELSAKVGGRYTYWRDLLAGKKSFGEKAARKIEEGLGLLRGSLDQARSPKSGPENMGEGKHPHGGTEEKHNVSPSRRIPTVMPYTPQNLKSAILLMGSLLGVLDLRSRTIIGELLKDLACHTDDAPDIAEKASALASVQQPITDNLELARAFRGRQGIAEQEQPPR